MPIKTSDRFFGEGIGSYGEADPHNAYSTHRRHIRTKRLQDLLGDGDVKLGIGTLIDRIDAINDAISAADKQAREDNVDFIKKYNIDA